MSTKSMHGLSQFFIIIYLIYFKINSSILVVTECWPYMTWDVDGPLSSQQSINQSMDCHISWPSLHIPGTQLQQVFDFSAVLFFGILAPCLAELSLGQHYVSICNQTIVWQVRNSIDHGHVWHVDDPQDMDDRVSASVSNICVTSYCTLNYFLHCRFFRITILQYLYPA